MTTSLYFAKHIIDMLEIYVKYIVEILTLFFIESGAVTMIIEIFSYTTSPFLYIWVCRAWILNFWTFLGLSLSEEGKILTVETAYLGCLVIVTICPELMLELSRIRVPLQLPTNQAELSKPRFMASYRDRIYVVDLGEFHFSLINFSLLWI